MTAEQPSHDHGQVLPPPPAFSKNAHVGSMDAYADLLLQGQIGEILPRIVTAQPD